MADEDWLHLKNFGWAPGGYMAQCVDCGERPFNMDKRAWRCRPCAEKKFAESQERMEQHAHAAVVKAEPKRISIGWVIMDPTTNGVERRESNATWYGTKRRSSKVYMSEKIAKRHAGDLPVAEAFVYL